MGKANFAEQFRKLTNRYKRIGYNPYIMRQTACQVVNPIMVDSYALLFNCTTVVRASDLMTASSLSFHRWVGAWCFVFGLARRGSTSGFRFSLFHHDSDQFDFVSSLWCIDWVKVAIMWTELFINFCIKKNIGTKGELCQQLKYIYPLSQR